MQTTYTVNWTVGNSVNALGNTVVTATLPNYVKFVQASSGKNIAFDSRTSTVTWTVGDLSEHQSQTASFQIAITPSISQVGSAPPVVSNQQAKAFDRYVQDTVSGSAPDLTTLSAAQTQIDGIVAQ